MSTKKKKTAGEREIESESARIFGKHVSKQKAGLLLAVTLLTCALPMVLGIRLWNAIPEVVSTGLIGMDGKDDSLPRAAVVFALPGLMCLLDLICHAQLYGYQKRMALPPAKFRLVGRWGFPVISVLFCGGMILESAGRAALSMTFVTPCVLGLLLLILGGHMWDCPRNAKIALRFSFTENSESAWRAVHRFAGWLWLAAGLLVIAGTMAMTTSTIMTAVLVLIALAAPMVYGQSMRNHLN
ncbi:SdpI family protein [uncultured Dysosmobacter sp.]|uniref:SdpI family protein n=1 Tax=uncultured Dysosmobacter sp. TaxID=2591384 RepID=UPI0026065B5C|nr:SdpI family protein [uncultured Dysosmobacter sp.]